MPVTSSEMKVLYRYTYLGQKCQNIQSYELGGAAFLTVDVVQVLEALWNDQKTVLRALMTDFIGDASWDSLVGYEIGGSLGYAEFAIPTLERAGTRSTAGLGEPVASFSAGGFRQTVGSRATRPGQKRFPFLFEADTLRQSLGTDYVNRLTAVAVKFSSIITLGAPVALGVMQPLVVHEPTPARPTRTKQLVTGYVINPDITTQVSRKKGRGD